MSDRAAPAGKGPATREIEVTPEMIEAGERLIVEAFNDVVNPGSLLVRDLAGKVFLAMYECWNQERT